MADLLIRGARLVPLTPGDAPPDHPVDVRVAEGAVVEVAERLERPEGVEEVAAEGRWLVPGLWDQHVHLGQWTLARQRFDLAGATSPEDVVARVGARIAEGPGQPLIGWGHRPGTWTRGVTVAELDEVTGVTPVVLIAGDAHHAWLNSAALAALGLPPREGEDQVVRENEWFAAYALLYSLTGTDGTSPAAYADTLRATAAQGVVGVVDLEFVGGVEDWLDRWGQGCDLLRVRMATYVEGLEDVVHRGLRSGMPLAGPGGDERLVMGPLKIISDGSLNTRTAWCCEPYADGDRLEHPRGAANLTGHELRHQLTRANVSGLEVATHAIGDAAVSAALDAYAATGAFGSIEHAQLVRREDVRRMAQLGLRASVQPSHLLDDRDLTELIWPGCAERSFAFRWMLDEGVTLVLGSDAPVSPLDPWLSIAAAVHRSDDDRDAWTPAHALTPQEALAASVDRQPMVQPGSRGDLALLDHDPLARGVEGGAGAVRDHLRGVTAALTTVGGSVVHRAV
ncbi:amidohydrolase [Nocardioides nanhaiensis]|uniref:Amidohydrolase family protein n=1 Tax=Nocardioides nanhaiensis TaxID=1476871 RepID=A0ABP8VRA6_9ACTN